MQGRFWSKFSTVCCQASHCNVYSHVMLVYHVFSLFHLFPPLPPPILGLLNSKKSVSQGDGMPRGGPGLRVAELRRTAVSYLLTHHLAHPHHLVPVSLAIMASPSKSAHVVTSPTSPDVVTPKKRRRAATPESPSVLSPALSVVTVRSSASRASRSRLSRSPGSPRLRQTNINLRSLYSAYSKEERVREIAFLRATSEVSKPQQMKSPCCVHVCMGRDIHLGACIAPKISMLPLLVQTLMHHGASFYPIGEP